MQPEFEIEWDADEWVFVNLDYCIQLYHRCEDEEESFLVGESCLNCEEPVPVDLQLERQTMARAGSILFDEEYSRPPFKLDM